jgi:hypothetical protein
MVPSRWSTALAAAAVLFSPLGASPALADTIEVTHVPVVRTAGTCPARVDVRVLTHQYEGGVTLDITAKTFAVAFVSEFVSATPHKIRFAASLRPAYASCKGSGHTADGRYAFAFNGGTLAYTITPGNGPNATPPGISLISTQGGNPRVIMSFTD